MSKPRPLTIAIPQADIDDLKNRLRHSRWPGDFGNDQGRYGAPRPFIETLANYWRDEYDWRKVELRMNAYDNQLVEIDGIPIHFLRMPGKGPNPTPIILTHGWPWTFWDLRKIIDPLADPVAHGGSAEDSFDVIVPSLPGYGFSVPLGTTGVDVAKVAELWVKLMRDVLGYERFGAQGGDWGAFITAQLGHAHAEHLMGVYLTMPVVPGMFGKTAAKAEDYADDERWMVERMQATRRHTEAHIAIHRRDPQTFAYAMADSPLGLGAWLWWRRHLWCDGDALEVFGRDDLCTLASLYWFHTAFASSIRLYAEQFSKPPRLAHDRMPVIEAPTGYGVFAKELLFTPRAVAEQRTNLKRWTVFDAGGHFAPAERPREVVEELRAFFASLR